MLNADEVGDQDYEAEPKPREQSNRFKSIFQKRRERAYKIEQEQPKWHSQITNEEDESTEEDQKPSETKDLWEIQLQNEKIKQNHLQKTMEEVQQIEEIKKQEKINEKLRE